MEIQTGEKGPKIFGILLKYLVPLLISTIFVIGFVSELSNPKGYDGTLVAIGWFILCLPFLAGVIVYAFIGARGSEKKILSNKI